MNNLTGILCLCSVVLMVGCEDALPTKDLPAAIQEMYDGYREDFPGIAEVEVAELGDRDWVIVDVREEEERAVSIIPGALSRDAFEAERETFSGRPVFIYCTIGYRSGLYTKKLQAQGLEAANLVGGILAWVADGKAVECAGQPTKRVHVYGRRWNKLPSDYEAVW